MVAYLNRLESPSPKGALCQVWLKYGSEFLQKIFKFCQCIYGISLLSPLGKKHGPSGEET